MASYKITGVEPRPDALVKLDVWVFLTGADTGNNAESVGHFDVILRAADVLAAFALPTTQERNVAMIALFESDARISGVVLAEEAAAAMDGVYNWPVVVEL